MSQSILNSFLTGTRCESSATGVDDVTGVGANDEAVHREAAAVGDGDFGNGGAIAAVAGHLRDAVETASL